MCMLIRRDQLKLRFACGPCRWWLRRAWWCLFLWTGGAAAAALPRAGFIPWTRPSCFIVSSVCLWRPICPSRSPDEHTIRRGRTVNSRTPVADRHRRIPSGKRARLAYVSHGAGRGCRLTAEVPGSRARRRHGRPGRPARGRLLAVRRSSVGPGTERTAPTPYRVPRDPEGRND
jgi:hypothetical protein